VINGNRIEQENLVTVADIIAIAGLTIGGVLGFSLASKHRSVRRVLAHLLLLVLIASAAGVFAAFVAAAGSSSFSRAASLARGISEAMNCAAYGLLAGAAVAALMLLWQRLRRS
jgi:hypothetical protein